MNHPAIRHTNPALWVMLAIPIVTIVASAWTLGVAYTSADAELPKSYATEGQAFDEDVRLRALAKRLGVRATIDLETNEPLTIDLDSSDPTRLPERLRLTVTHVSDPGRDHAIELRRLGESTRYVGRLEPLGAGRWLLQLDAPDLWRLRGRVETPFARTVIGP